MRKNKVLIIIMIFIGVGIFIFMKMNKNSAKKELTKEIKPYIGNIERIISTTGTVLPKNRLEVKAPVNGRIDSILVKEGEMVKAGQILAWMSSTERAALLDAARGKGEETLRYWEETYKAIPLLSPMDAQVIVATTQPAQTITTQDAVVVLSDKLIVRAQVDETDIGKISLGQKANITVDAYSSDKIPAVVDHIYYESKLTNNVTIYEVDLITDQVPTFFRSGMTATVDFKQESVEGALVLPIDAVHQDKRGYYVLVKDDNAKEPRMVPVQVGISDDNKIQILSGITEDDFVIVKSKKFSLPKNSTGTNPFMPNRQRRS